MIDHCLTAFFMIISMAILIFMLLIIPASWASAETVSRDGVLVIGKVTENPKNYPRALEVVRKDLLQIVRDKLE